MAVGSVSPFQLAAVCQLLLLPPPSQNLVTMSSMSPRSVTPPGTGCAVAMACNGRSAMVARAMAWIVPCAVGTLTMVKRPSTPLVAVRPLLSVIVAPSTGALPLVPSNTRPLTVVLSSAPTVMTLCTVVALPSTSSARAASVRPVTSSGTVTSVRKGAAVSVKTALPSTKKITRAMPNSAVAVAVTGIVAPSSTVVPLTGSVMVTAGAAGIFTFRINSLCPAARLPVTVRRRPSGPLAVTLTTPEPTPGTL